MHSLLSEITKYCNSAVSDSEATTTNTSTSTYVYLKAIRLGTEEVRKALSGNHPQQEVLLTAATRVAVPGTNPTSREADTVANMPPCGARPAHARQPPGQRPRKHS